MSGAKRIKIVEEFQGWFISAALMMGVLFSAVLLPKFTAVWFASSETKKKTEAKAKFLHGTDVASQTDDQVLSHFKSIIRMERDSQRMQALYAFLETVDKKQMSMLMDYMKDVESSSRYNVEKAILAKWVELDPHAASDYVSKMGGYDAYEWMAFLYHTWMGYDETAPLAYINEIANLTDDTGLLWEAKKGVIDFLAQSDPHRALQAASQLDKDFPYYHLLREAIKPWAQKDPQSAASYVMSMTSVDLKARERMFSVIAQEWAKTDYADALIWLKRNENEVIDQVMLGPILNKLAKQDPQGAADYLLKIDKGITRSELTQKVVKEWTKQEPVAALEWVMQHMEAADLRDGVQGVMQQWSKQDPNSAMDFAVGLESGPLRDSALTTTLKSWLKEDVDQAVELIKNSVTDDPSFLNTLTMSIKDRSQHMRGLWQPVMKVWMQNDFDSATQFISQISDSQAQVDLIKAVYNGFSGKDPSPSKLLAWAETLSGDAGELAISNAVSRLFWRNQDKAVQYVESMNSGDLQKECVTHVARGWSFNDPKGAANWLMKFEDETRAEAVSELTSSWLYNDEDGAMEWVDTLPSGASRDAGVKSIISKFYQKDPEGAFAWAESMDSDELRFANMEKVALAWLELDEKAARTKIENASLPDPIKNKLLEMQ